MIRCELLLNLKFTIRFCFGSESSLAFGTWPWSHGVLALDDSLHLQTGKVCCLPRAKDQEGASICQEYKLLPSVTLSSQHDSNRKKSLFQSECMKNDFLHWLKGYLLWDLSLLFTSVIAISLIAIISYAISVDAWCIPLIFMHMHIFFHLGRRAVYSLTLINIFFHRRNFLHRLSAVIMGLETKCLCTADIFRNWI